MSLLSYQLQTKRYQRESGIDNRTFNALDVKHSDINLLKQLQLLNPIVSGPPASAAVAAPVAGDIGFYGTFVVFNETAPGSGHRHMHVYLAFNDTALTNSVQINGGTNYTFTVAIEDRLPLPSSTLQLKLTMQNGTDSVDLDDYDGFEPTGLTELPITEENTMSMLIDSNNLVDGECSVTFVVSYE